MSIRITDSYLSSILVGDLNRSLASLLEQQRMAGSMQRVNSYADDPRAVSSIQQLNALITRNDSYLRNIGRSRTLVDGTDIALQDLSEILADARVLAMRESSSLANSDTMGNAVFEIDNLVGRMLEVLNTSIEGHHLFAGQRTDEAPFRLSGGSVVYLGDDGEIIARTGPHSTMPVNLSGDIFMGSQSASLAGRTRLGPVLTDGTLLSDLNGGEGWQSGGITVSVGGADPYRVDLTGAVTVGDVISQIQVGTKGVVTASIAADGRGLVLEGPAPVTIGEVDGGQTASSLGINTTTDGTTLRGGDIRALPDRDTLLADIPDLVGHLPLGSMEIVWEGGVTQLDLGLAVTIGDLQDHFATALPGMSLNLQDGYLQVVGPSSASFTIRDVGGSTTASILGIRGDGTPVRLFGVMEDLQAALRSGDKDAVQGAVSELMALSQTVSGLLIRNGGRQNDLDWAVGILQQRNERLQSNLSLERDVDITQLAADLSRAEASYQASLLVTSKLFENNLMKYLR